MLGQYGLGRRATDRTAQSLHGLTSTSDWEGVPVKTLMNEVGVKSERGLGAGRGQRRRGDDAQRPYDKLLDDAFIA